MAEPHAIPPDIETQLIAIEETIALLRRPAANRAMEVGGYANATHVGTAAETIRRAVASIREGLERPVEPEA